MSFCSQVSTLIGYGSPNKADTHDVHGAPLGKDETAATRKNLKWPYGEFEVRAVPLHLLIWQRECCHHCNIPHTGMTAPKAARECIMASQVQGYLKRCRSVKG